MKRFFVVFLIILMLFGCSKKPDTEPLPDESPEVTVTPTATHAPTPTPSPSPSPPVSTAINPLNGMPLDEDHARRRPVAVMYNILKAALPVHGITQADLIYEIEAEGGITRVVGMFADVSDVPRIGTVRSTRAYYLDLAQGHDALLMHAGYSDEAKKLIETRKLYTLNGLSGTFTFYYRDQQRVKSAGLEHSLFANGPDVEAFILEKVKSRINYNEDYDPFSLRFSDSALPEGDVSAKKASVKFSNYKTGVFEYNESDGLYYVSQYGKPFIDGENSEQLAVKNVLVLYTSITNTGDAYGHLKVKMTGTGKGLFICGGKAEEITWSKKSPDDPFVYTQTDGNPLKLSTGVSYINIAATNAKVALE